MKLHHALVVLTLMGATTASYGRVIYGQDNRLEVSDATLFQKNLASSAASMVSNSSITRDAKRPGFVELNQSTLKDWLESMEDSKSILSKDTGEEGGRLSFCDGERFINQPNAATCSGFLIAPDLIVTAGHCVQEQSSCSDYSWVFGFEYDSTTQSAGKNIKESDVYTCKRVISNALNMTLGLDYGLIQLDRKVAGRLPLDISIENKISDLESLFIIGSPSGLPLKVAAGANVRNNSHPYYFSANLDSFQGNSGSGVFNAMTGVIEGILVRGEQDFVVNKEKGCVESKKCADDSCRGEDVTRLTSIPEVGVQASFIKASESGDILSLEKILSLNIWIDFYSKDGRSALLKAIKAGKISSVEFLLSRGADVNLQDAEGNSALHLIAENLSLTSSELLKVVLKYNPKMDLKNNLGETPISIATALKNNEVIKILNKSKPKA